VAAQAVAAAVLASPPPRACQDKWQPRRHEVQSPKRHPKESAQGRLPQSDLPQ
jgi:hypothetical protein